MFVPLAAAMATAGRSRSLLRSYCSAQGSRRSEPVRVAVRDDVRRLPPSPQPRWRSNHMRRRQMVAMRSSTTTKLVAAMLLALAIGLIETSSVRAADKKPNFGRIEISTNPGGYPISVDGRPAVHTTAEARLIDLPPGRHTVEIAMPNGARWVREFNVVAGRKNCIVLNYKARAVPVTPKSPCPYPVNVSAPASVNEGDYVTFNANVSYGGSSALNYTWTVSPPTAVIRSGAGTSTIEVDTTGVGKQLRTALLVADDGTGDRSCRQTAQASTDILAPTPPP